jgi:hypothetical protein
VVTELLDVGDAFECLHGGSPFDGHKKARRRGGREGEPGRAQSGVVRVDAVRTVTIGKVRRLADARHYSV